MSAFADTSTSPFLCRRSWKRNCWPSARRQRFKRWKLRNLHSINSISLRKFDATNFQNTALILHRNLIFKCPWVHEVFHLDRRPSRKKSMLPKGLRLQSLLRVKQPRLRPCRQGLENVVCSKLAADSWVGCYGRKGWTVNHLKRQIPGCASNSISA